MTDWAIPQQAKLKYTQLFNLHDRNRTGFLSGVQCRDILMQSGLPRNILAEIWNLSDIDGDGQLTREEFILAMHLTNQVRAGHALPAQLTPDLIPPSYRRQRSISSTSVQSTASASSSIGGGIGTTSAINDDNASHRSTETASVAQGSILNSNSFEDKRRENFEKGRAELERRRLKIIEQQSSVLSEQLVQCKKQVAEAKSKIDSMRSERDTKAGLLTSLEAQLKTVRDRKAFLEHEEVQLIAIAKDLNLVNSVHSVEFDQQATQAKQDSINRMKEKIAALTKERDEAIKKSLEAKSRVETLGQELKSISEEASKLYSNYKEQIAKAKTLKEQIAQEGKSRLVDLESAWDTAGPAFSSSFNQHSSPAAKTAEPTSTFATASVAEDPWAPGSTQISADLFAPESNNNTSSANNNFDPLFPNISPKINDQSSPFAAKTSSGFSDGFASSMPETPQKKKTYKAIYAFDARNVDELTIKPGDIIIGSEEICEPGWLSGTIGVRTGLFPEAYVEPLTDGRDGFIGEANTPASSLATNISNQQNNTSMTSSYQETEAIQQHVASSMLPSIVRYKVLYSFEARNVDELNMNPGDIITGVEGPHEPGWLMGELNGQRGLFPEAYVEKLADTQVEQANAVSEQMGTLRRGSSSGSLRSKKSRAKKAEVATVIANYRALGQEQLNLEKGQLVLIRRKMDSGWWEGELQIKEPAKLTKYSKFSNTQPTHTNELDHLIGELVDSEWDYVNDLRLCQSAYIFPLCNSFDVSQIFTNWNQLIQMHEFSLTKLTESSKLDKSAKFDYCLVFETFQSLFSSIVELYVDFCSRQNESTRQLEAKIVSDIRFKQLVSESQRRLRKLIEQQVDKSVQNEVHIHSAEQARALRNSNLPLTSFLIKPMQRITKYGLLFERMLHISNIDPNYKHLQPQLKRLKESAGALCNQVNEACRRKEDHQDNDRRLRWCQNHIKQPGSSSYISDSPNLRSCFGYSSMSSVELRLSSSMSAAVPTQDSSNFSFELIQFNSTTRSLGRRWLVKAGSLSKFPSGRELVAFLFNDFLLLTQTKGGTMLRVEDVFRSDRAQQSYYKFYRPPILLEDIQLDDFDNDQLFQSLSCASINSSSSSGVLAKEQEALLISFLDRNSGCIYNLIASSVKEKADWANKLKEKVLEAQNARNSYETQKSLVDARRLSMSDSQARLFVTVIELTRITSGQSNQRPHSLSDLNSSWKRRLDSSNQIDSIQNLCVRMQMRLYKKAQLNSGEKRQVVALSEEFQTDPVTISESRRQPLMVDMNESMSNLETQRDKYKFDRNSTQFLIARDSIFAEQGYEYLDVELNDDSRFRETRLLGRKRIRLDQLLGRNTTAQESKELARRTISQSMRSIPPLQPNRPVDMVFKLKPAASDLASSTGQQHSPVSGRSSNYDDQQRFNLKLRFHLQLFCDNASLI